MSKILIVDDDQGQLDLFSTAFKLKGFDVETVTTGAECLEKAREYKPDLILLDIVLIKESGLDVLAQIRSDALLGQMKVFIITNLSRPGLADEALSAGANGFAMKADLTPSELVEKAKQLINS